MRAEDLDLKQAQHKDLPISTASELLLNAHTKKPESATPLN